MNSSSRVLVVLLLVGVAAFIATLLLPDDMASTWVKIAQPSLLLLGAALALLNAKSYRAELSSAFLLFAGFLVLYGLLNIEPLNDRVFEWLADGYFRWLLVYQIIDYGLLLAACFFILKAVVASRMSRVLWLSVSVAVILAAAILWKALAPYDDLAEINRDAANIYLLTRLFDAIVAVALVPVVALYVENSRRTYKESASFAMVLSGVIVGLFFVYLYELISGSSLQDLATESELTGSLLDGIHILGYCTIVAGLAAHWLNHRLTFSDLDKLLEPSQ